jgi:hypothetical protein
MATMPHFHVSGTHATIVFLFVVAVFGSLHLLAASMPHNQVSQAWIALGF